MISSNKIKTKTGLTTAVAAALALFFACGRASADTQAQPADPVAAAAAVAPNTGMATAAAGPGDALREGEKRLRGMMARVASIKHVRDRPAVQKDGSTQSCVQYQDARARVVLQMAQEAHRSLTVAASENNGAERAYQSGRLVMLDDMLKAVQKSAQLCIQEELSTVHVVKVDVEVDDGVPKADPTGAPGTTLSAERPAER